MFPEGGEHAKRSEELKLERAEEERISFPCNTAKVLLREAEDPRVRIRIVEEMEEELGTGTREDELRDVIPQLLMGRKAFR
jgi:hypothetical protein